VSPEAPVRPAGEDETGAGPREEPAAGRREPPSLSVIITTYRRERLLIETMESVLAQDPPAFEIIVVDQTPEHETATEEFLQRLAGEGKIRRVREEIANLPRARNVGVAHARGEVILFLDDDVLLTPGFLASHTRHYGEADVWGVGGRVAREEEELTRERPLPPRLAARTGRWSVLASRYTTPLVNPLRLVGGNFSCRRERFIALDGFNENYAGDALGEDVEFLARARRAALRSGARILYDPEAVFIHRVALTGGCRVATTSWLTHHRRRARNKYYTMIRAVGWLGAAGETLRAILALPPRAVRRLLNRPAPQEEPVSQPRPGPVAEILAGPGGRAMKFLRLLRYKLADWLGTALGLLQGAGCALLDRRVTGHYHRIAPLSVGESKAPEKSDAS